MSASLLAFGSFVGGALVYLRGRHARPARTAVCNRGHGSQSAPPSVRVSELWVYPVKSMRGSKRNHVELDAHGIKHDRRFMVCTAAGDFKTQRQLPKMAALLPELVSDSDGDYLLLTSATSGALSQPLKVPILTSRDVGVTLQTVRIWDQAVEGAVDQGNAVGDWLCDALGEPDLRLFYMDDVCVRRVNHPPTLGEFPADSPGIVGFADGYPILLLGEESVGELNSRMPRPEDAVGVDRFRPNIVVKGASPFAEDSWLKFSINGMPMSGVKRCSRCRIPTIPQITGDAPEDGMDAEPTVTLREFRRGHGLKADEVYMGINVMHGQAENWCLQVGDAVLVHKIGVMPPE